MKKLLLIFIAVFGLSTMVMAQNPVPAKKAATTNAPQAKADTVAVVVEKAMTIEDLSFKIDKFIKSQTEFNNQIERRINVTIAKERGFGGSLIMLVRELIPMLVLAVIGGFLVWIIYIISMNNYKVNQARYDTILKCTESTGSVPDFFNKSEKIRANAIPIGGRVHLILSIICGTLGLIFIFCTMGLANRREVLVCGFAALGFIVAAVLLFKQYNKISENSRNREE